MQHFLCGIVKRWKSKKTIEFKNSNEKKTIEPERDQRSRPQMKLTTPACEPTTGLYIRRLYYEWDFSLITDLCSRDQHGHGKDARVFGIPARMPRMRILHRPAVLTRRIKCVLSGHERSQWLSQRAVEFREGHQSVLDIT